MGPLFFAVFAIFCEKFLLHMRTVNQGDKQRLDSTPVLGAVAKMNRLELVRETVRLVLEEIQNSLPLRS